MMKQFFIQCIEATRADQGALSTDQKHMKLSEEVGELAKAMLAQEGKVRIKPDIEPPIFEAADAMLCIIDILSACYLDHTPEELWDSFNNALKSKYKKWEGYMIENNKNICPECKHPWDEHDFGIPTPYCP